MFLSDTAGALSGSPGTVEKPVARAISATQVVRLHEARRVAGTIADIGEAETGATTVTLGFRPSRLFVQARARSVVCDDVGSNCQASARRVWMEIVDGQPMGIIFERSDVVVGSLIDVTAAELPGFNTSATIDATEVDGVADNTITCTLVFAITDTGFTHTKDTSTTNAGQTDVLIDNIRWVAQG